MIYSTGIDLVEISRIEKTFKRHGDRFMRRMFTDDETVKFYKHLGFKEWGVGLGRVVGEWLQA